MEVFPIFSVYLDSNIIIDYCWHTYFAESKNNPVKEKKEIVDLIERGKKGEFEIVLSTYVTIEVFEHFRDYYLLDKCLKSGYGYQEFRRYKQKYHMTKSEKDLILGMIEGIEDDKDITFVKIKAFNNAEVEEYHYPIIYLITEYIDFKDALHVQTAIDVDCDYFVTKDSDLRNRIQNLINRKMLDTKLKPRKVNDFLRILNKKM